MTKALDTTRMVLRAFRAADVGDVCDYAVRAEFWRYLALPPQTLETVTAFVAERVAAPSPDGQGDWQFAAESKADGRVIGPFRVGTRSARHRRGDIGYALSPRPLGTRPGD